MATPKKVGFLPLEDRILVKRDDNDEEVKMGIIIPDTAKEKPIRGTVVAVGSGKSVVSDGGSVKRVDPVLKAGDVILFGKWSGTELKINGEDFLIMKESDVFGIIQ